MQELQCELQMASIAFYLTQRSVGEGEFGLAGGGHCVGWYGGEVEELRFGGSVVVEELPDAGEVVVDGRGEGGVAQL